MNKTSAVLIRTLLLGTSCLSVFAASAALADPTGGNVVYGAATITNRGANTTIIDQKTGKAVINWDSFSIAAGGTVRFNQPGSGSIALNRVIGSEASAIYGSLLANGQVWLINGNGILFGGGSRINVGGLIATTADIADRDFASGNYSFSGGSGASIVNDGSIRAKNGGSVVLSGASVSNHGLVAADTGTVVLGGASAFTVDFVGDGLLKYAITAPAAKADEGAATGVSNSGTLSAVGGHVIMTARAVANVADAVVNNTGMISATSAKVQNGEVILDGGDGDVSVSGSIDASGVRAGQTGGSVAITGRNITVADNTQIDVSGDVGGGTVRIGGDLHGAGALRNADNVHVGSATIRADATRKGKGGTLVVWSNGLTDFSGIFSAQGGAMGGDGGFVETSGHTLRIAPQARVDTTAPHGHTGTWLLDPAYIVIANDGTTGLTDGTLPVDQDSEDTDTIAPATIIAALATTNVSLEASQDITVNDAVIYSSANTLSLLAEHDITVNASIQNSQAEDGGGINLIAGWDGVTPASGSLMDDGVYGNNEGQVGIGGGTGDVAVGSASGTTLVEGSDIYLSAFGANAQLGYHGGGGGDIVVRSLNGATIQAFGGTAQLGNGSLAGDVPGDTTGNIDVRAGGTFSLAAGEDDNSLAWLGNTAGETFSETGNVILIAGDGNVDLGFEQNIIADLAGGDFTLGTTGDGGNGVDGLIYNSTHNLTLLTTGDLEITSTLANEGSGAITLVAGWDGTSLTPAELHNASAYGNNDAAVTIGGADAAGEVFVGSQGGAVTVLTDYLFVDAENGNAQLGYKGAGIGDINVLARDDIGLIGGDPLENGFYAMIGNGALDGSVDGVVGGNIFLSAGATLFLESASGIGCDCNDETGGQQALAQEGGVTVGIGNAVAFDAAPPTGNVVMLAGAFDDELDANGGFSRIITDDLANGDVTFGTTGCGCGVDIYNDIIYDSSHNLTLLSTGDIVIEATVQNAGSGAITLVAGWNGDYDPDHLTDPGAFGLNDGTIAVGGPYAAGGVSIGSASGALNLYGANLFLASETGYAQVGYHGAGGGDITVRMTGDVELDGSEGFSAMIGNGAFAGDAGGDVTGNIDIRAAGTLFLEAEDSEANPVNVWIGNVAGEDFAETGNVTVVADSLCGCVDFGQNIAADLAGGDFTLGLTSLDTSFIGGVLYDSAHNLTLLTAGDMVVGGSVANEGAGAITLVGGWDGVALRPDEIAAAGAFGNNDATITIGGAESGDVFVGSKSGAVNVFTANLSIDAEDGYAQLGYHGAGTGAITVDATGDLTIENSDGAGTFAQLGNGALGGDVTDDVGGDIFVQVGGTTSLLQSEEPGGGGASWFGNRTAGAGVASGNVTLITGDVANSDEFDGAYTLGAMLLADLGTTAQAGSGGDVTLAITAPQTDFINTYLGMGVIAYSSPHGLTLLSTSDITLPYSIQNDGSGALTILAGWNPAVAPADVLTTPGAYGNPTQMASSGEGTITGGAFVWVVGGPGDNLVDSNPSSSGGYSVGASGTGTAIGSKGGTTTIGAAQIYIEGLSGYAQIGYHASGGTGDIDVIANGAPGSGGLTGIGGCFDGFANICLIGGRDGESGGNPTYAQIGDLGLGVAGTAASNIHVTATGNISIAGGGIYSSGDDGNPDSDPGIANAYGQIGNGDASRTTVQIVGGTIFVTAGGRTTFASSSGAGSAAWLGNRTASGGTQGGNITLITGSLHGKAISAMLAEDLAGGDATIGITNSTATEELDDPLSYNSAHTLNLLTAGSFAFESSIQNGGSGAINIVAGWNGTTLDAAHFADAGVFGNNNGGITIGGAGASGNVAVGSAGGQVNLAARTVTVLGVNGYAQLGYHGAATGSITVNALGAVSLSGASPANYAQIGSGTVFASNAAGGNVSVSAASIGALANSAMVAAGLKLATAGGGIATAASPLRIASGTLQLQTAGSAVFLTSPNNGVTFGGTGANLAGGALTLVAGGPIGQTAAIHTGNLTISTTGGAITLTNAANMFGGLTVTTTGSDNATFAHASFIGVTSANVGGTLTLSAAGNISQTGAIHAGALSVSSSGGTITLSNSGNAFATLSVATSGTNAASLADSTAVTLANVAVGGSFTLAAGGAIGQTAAIHTGALNVSTTSGAIALSNAANTFSTLTVVTHGADNAAFAHSGNLVVAGANVGGTLTLAGGSGLNQTGAIVAGGLNASTGSGVITLTHGGNAFATLTVTTAGDASLFDSSAVTIAGANVGGTLTLAAGGAIGQSGAIVAANLAVSSTGGAITLNNSGNSFATLTVATTGSNDASLTDAGALAVASANVGGKLTLAAGGAVSQSGAIVAHALSVSTTSGAITLARATNAVAGTVQLATPGSAIFANSLATNVGTTAVGGDLTLLSKGNVNFFSSVQGVGGNVTVVAGWDGTTTDASLFGNAGVYGNANGGVTIGGTGATGNVAVGSKSGTTSLYASFVNVAGNNGTAQLGYHGQGGGNIKVVALHDMTLSGAAFSAMLGNGSLTSDVTGNITGDIDVRLGGNAVFNGGGANAQSWFGNVAHSGSASGNVVFVMADESGSQNNALASFIAADLVGGDFTLGFTGSGDQGPQVPVAYNSSHTFNALTVGNWVVAASVQNAGSGAINVVAGWDGHTLAPASFGTAGVYGNNGKGIVIGGATAPGNVALGSAGGTTSVYGASLALSAVNGYAQLGFNGHGTGAILVKVTGGVAVTGGSGSGQYAQIGNGGRGTSGSNSGDISITAGGDLVMTAGSGAEAYSQIGHGGAESNTGSSGYSNVAAITVSAANVRLNAGSGSAAYVQIGNGGYKSGLNLAGGSAVNGGNITITSAHAVSLLGNGADAYAQIGNGGSQSNLNAAASAGGSDSGDIVVHAPNGGAGSVTLAAGAGANAYAQIGNGGYAVNSGPTTTLANWTITGNVTVTDLALSGGNSGINAYAQIGNGDASRNSTANVSGNITIDANGQITYTNGLAAHSPATIGNFTGLGTVSGLVTGDLPPPPVEVGDNPIIIGIVVGDNPDTGAPGGGITPILTIVIDGDENNGGATTVASLVPSKPGPLASLDDNGTDSSSPNNSDSATVVIADSLDGAIKASNSQSILNGMLKQTGAGSGVHGVPPADQDFSSWGNEALWQ